MDKVKQLLYSTFLTLGVLIFKVLKNGKNGVYIHVAIGFSTINIGIRVQSMSRIRKLCICRC